MKFMLTKQAAACALLAAAAAAQAGAVAADVDALKTMSPTQRQIYLKSIAARRAPTPFSPAASGVHVDIEPPVLTSFRVTPPADVSKAESQLVVDITATDNLSGVMSATAYLSGPHGQTTSASVVSAPPARNYAGHLTLDTTPYLEPGSWRVTEIFVTDLAGNSSFVMDAELAALGNPDVVLLNGQPESVDITPAVLKGGKVLTPQVSVTSLAKGSDILPAFLAASFTASDAAQSSGIQSVAATWCRLDGLSCISTWGYVNLRGQAKATVSTSSQVYSGWMTGDYVLEYLSVTDWAGNFAFLQGKEFGGTTDFSKLMPQGHTITLTP